ncbi:outer membrane beta-barrel protein [Christiangramia sp. OXR-203]|uniref:outer membrane beta-barrel protein n=1 Tax=Christiangramia sp. OXR-203 TaxID=3100176 RepID=UPI002AC8E318|nr:outer membrane beta-barrel protein [Christiangramia sp. OXR-203]WPY98570.1 hypothetical protein T8I65_15515 [Christiangramia sp. OXR-203]
MKKLLVIVLLFIAVKSFSQRYRDFEVGPSISYAHTSLYLSQDVFGSGESDSFTNSGFEPNYAVGIYAIYYLLPKAGFGAELYWQRTSASDLSDNEHYNSLTFMPYVNFDPFNQIENVLFGAGIGASFIQNSPDYGNVLEEDIRVITIPAKLSVSYRVRNQFTFEISAQAEVLEVVRDQVRRNSILLGFKIPFNRVFGNYR